MKDFTRVSKWADNRIFCPFLFFTLMIWIINDKVLRNFIYKWYNLNESLLIDRWSSLVPNLLVCYFPRNLAQILKRNRSTYVWKIVFHSFYTFKVITHFVEAEGFLDKHSATFLNITSGIFFCRVLLNSKSKVDIKFKPSILRIMEIISLKSNTRKTFKNSVLTKQRTSS